MKKNSEKYIRRNKMLFYSFVIIGLFVGISGIIGGSLLLFKENVPLYGGLVITITSIGLIIFIFILIHNKPDFKPRIIKKLRIQNKSLNKIEDDIINWFKQNKFDIRKEKSNYFIGSKIINDRVKYIFEISIKEKKNLHNLIGEFYLLFNYNSKIFSLRESSPNNNRFAMESFYRRPAWHLMEDLIKNLQ